MEKIVHNVVYFVENSCTVLEKYTLNLKHALMQQLKLKRDF